jgi:hypothetical protein
MRGNFTSHLAGDLAALHDALQARRSDLAWQLLYEVPRPAPDRPALRAEADGLDRDLETLRSPEATPDELAWVRNGRGRSEAYTAGLTPDTWTSATVVGAPCAAGIAQGPIRKMRHAQVRP